MAHLFKEILEEMALDVFLWHDYFVVKFQSLLTKNQEDTPVSQHAGENQLIG